MKARVIDYLNVRTGKPAVLPNNNPGYYRPNEIIEIAETVIGENYKENDVWYKLTDGAFVWSGGVDKDITSKVKNLENSKYQLPTNYLLKISWAHSSLKILDIWMSQSYGNMGEGINVAVFDTGYDILHDDLREAVKGQKNFCDENAEVVDKDKHSHGTECCGIIAGRGNKVYGVAPKVNLFVGKVMENRIGYKCTNIVIEKALDWVLNNDRIDILSLSNQLPDSANIRKLIKDCYDKDIVIVAASGNDGAQDLKKSITPASYDECLTVGAFNKQRSVSSFSNWADYLDILGPGEQIRSCIRNNGIKEDVIGTSIASAFVSGTLALLINAARKVNSSITNKRIVQILLETAQDVGAEERDDRTGYGIINPYQTFLRIKKRLL